MSMIAEWARRVWHFLNRRRFERELEREMASHRAQLQDPRRFGSALRLREQAADVWGWTWVDNLVHDIRYGARQLRQAPAFAALAILTLTLGIGANTAAFSIVNGELFVYPPVHDPRSLRTLDVHDSFSSVTDGRNLPYDAFLSLTEARSFAAAACATGVRPVSIAIDTNTLTVPMQRATGDYFRTLGVNVVQGRSLIAADSLRGAAPVAVISNAMWHRLLGAAPDAIGREITIEGAPVTIVGVTPPGFYVSPAWRRVDVTVAMQPPVLSTPPIGAREEDDGRCHPILRLRAGISDRQAEAETSMLIRPFFTEPSPAFGARRPSRFMVRVTRLGRGIDELDRRRIENEAAAIAAVSFLFATMLLIPCANIAGIMLARTVTRRREITTRLAMGAWRGRIVRQLLTEGLLLSAIAGVLGVLLAHSLFLSLRPPGSGTPVVLDIRVLLYSAGLCLATAVGFVTVPALRATRVDLASTMRDGSGRGFGHAGFTAGKVLTGAQVLLASVLVIGTAVQVRNLIGMMAPRGVEPERVTLIPADIGTRDGAVSYVRRALNELQNVPGVEVASAVGGAGLHAAICDPTLPAERQVVMNDAFANIVAPGFLRSTRIPLTAGRDLRWDEETAVINESLARRLYGETNPIGQTLLLSQCREPLTVVGVVADSNNAVGAGFTGGNGTDPTLYVSLSSGVFDIPLRGVTFFVRAGAAPVPADTLIKAVRDADASVPIFAAQTQAELLARDRLGQRTALSLLAGVSLLAIFQAAFGLYAVLAHFVTRRTAEIGIRSVLGATPGDVIRLVVRQSLAPVGIGLGIAIGLAPVAVSVLAKARLTPPLGAGDQLAVLVPVLALLLAAFAAACGPALRATRIAPSVAVRAD
jgi:predicted permease